MDLARGDIVVARTAYGDEVRMRALGTPTRGRDFDVVWLATETDWANAAETESEPSGIPWPVDAVRPPEPV